MDAFLLHSPIQERRMPIVSWSGNLLDKKVAVSILEMRIRNIYEYSNFFVVLY